MAKHFKGCPYSDSNERSERYERINPQGERVTVVHCVECGETEATVSSAKAKTQPAPEAAPAVAYQKRAQPKKGG